jgi:hypothetical protein
LRPGLAIVLVLSLFGGPPLSVTLVVSWGGEGDRVRDMTAGAGHLHGGGVCWQMYMAVVLICVAVFCISLGLAVGIRVCPGGCIEVSLFNCITVAVWQRCAYFILHNRWHCVSCRVKILFVNCPEHLYSFVVARIGMRL